jgi:hypothetical protein
MKLLRFNEMSEWQKDIRLIMDIINIAKDDNSLEVTVASAVSIDIESIDFEIKRSNPASNTFEFCEVCQNITERLRKTGHKIDVVMRFQRPSWPSDIHGRSYHNTEYIKNPIEFAYNTDLSIIYFRVSVSDPKKTFMQKMKDRIPFRKNKNPDEKI